MEDCTDVGWVGRQDSLRGQVRFMLPLAPTVTVTELERYANAASNPLISRFHWASGHLVENRSVKAETISKLQRGITEEGSTRSLSEQPNVEELGHLVTERGVSIQIRQEFPPYSLYQGCTICLTTVLFYPLHCYSKLLTHMLSLSLIIVGHKHKHHHELTRVVRGRPCQGTVSEKEFKQERKCQF